MYVSVHHTITDQQKWDQNTQKVMAMVEQGKLPAGMKGHMFLPGADGRKADCIRGAPSVDALKSFLDRETGTAAKNEYMAIKAKAAAGAFQDRQLHNGLLDSSVSEPSGYVAWPEARQFPVQRLCRPTSTSGVC